MGKHEKLSGFTTDDLLMELAARCSGSLDKADTLELVDELTKRDGVDVTLVEKDESVRMRVRGPAIVLTIFD